MQHKSIGARVRDAAAAISNFEGSDPVASALNESARRLMKLALFSGVINLLTLSGSIYMLQVYDRVIPSRSLNTLVALSALLAFAYLLQGYLDALRARMLARVGALFEVALQEPLYTSLVALPLRGAPPLHLQQPMRDMESIRNFLSGMGPTALLDMPWMPLFLIVLFVFHPMIGATAVTGAASILAVTLHTERRSKSVAKDAPRWMAERHLWAEATRRNADAIRSMGMRQALFERWKRINENSLEHGLRIMDVHAAMGATAKMIRYGLQSAILGVGAYLVVRDQASGGVMIASSIIMGRALAPMEIALGSWRQLVAARDALRRLRRDLPSSDAAPHAPLLPPPQQSLTVHNISVAGPGTGTEILTGVSFELHAGTGLAIVGPSGSGKTSLAKALAGVWPPTRGAIKLDGASLDQWHPDHLGRHVGYLPQDVSLFEGTVAENIARFEPHAPPQAVVRAAMLANAHEMILRLPDGYHTRIGEDGVRLSGGQRQRIGLARAAYGSPFLIILDEPNSNLDSEGEAALYKAIASFKRLNSIVVVVTHRPGAMQHLDEVLVLVKGRMIAAGPKTNVSAALSQMSAKVSAHASVAGSHILSSGTNAAAPKKAGS
ncbi:MAG: type I secretion system permease/ATPase [Bacteroidota bacterium]